MSTLCLKVHDRHNEDGVSAVQCSWILTQLLEHAVWIAVRR